MYRYGNTLINCCCCCYKIVPADDLFAESMQSHAGYLGSLSIHNDQDFYTKKILIKTSEQNMCKLGVT